MGLQDNYDNATDENDKGPSFDQVSLACSLIKNHLKTRDSAAKMLKLSTEEFMAYVRKYHLHA
ncbi:MAG TPA: hypothetical protein DEO62_03125 [Lachnospiraceae bacterium]|jgi:hypothetical protein|nr:hypothetical protein [Lachnospiraceae bacterium]HBR04545.1 hypothetical protein [Lachnospiraceae bacterium]HBZ89997.1 hypothetical protein [Lachnospiraceae bacterium]